MKLSVCIPMYNESRIIEETARTLSEYLLASGEDYELLFCDDGSTDEAAELVERFALPNTRVIGYKENRGKGCAVRTAMLAAEGDILLFTDADLAYGTEVIASAVKTFRENPESEVVIGSRNLEGNGYEGYTWSRKLASKAYIRLLCLMGGFHLTDSQCGCKAFRREAAREIFRRCEVDGFAFDFEVLLWAEELGYAIREMPVKIINHRDSKVRLLRDSLKMLKDLTGIRSRVKKKAKKEKSEKTA